MQNSYSLPEWARNKIYKEEHHTQCSRRRCRRVSFQGFLFITSLHWSHCWSPLRTDQTSISTPTWSSLHYPPCWSPRHWLFSWSPLYIDCTVDHLCIDHLVDNLFVFTPHMIISTLSTLLIASSLTTQLIATLHRPPCCSSLSIDHPVDHLSTLIIQLITFTLIIHLAVFIHRWSALCIDYLVDNPSALTTLLWALCSTLLPLRPYKSLLTFFTDIVINVERVFFHIR